MNDNIDDVVIALIAKSFELPVRGISLVSQFVDDLDIDSLSVVELVMEVEEVFDIAISNDEVKRLVAVKDLTDLIRHKISSPQAA